MPRGAWSSIAGALFRTWKARKTFTTSAWGRHPPHRIPRPPAFQRI